MVAALMAFSCATVAASAAEVEDAAAAADENSVVAAADESSEVAQADESSQVSNAGNTINFKIPDDWKNVKQMYAHIWMCIDDGSFKWPSWKSKA